jgi:hypothetical protein
MRVVHVFIRPAISSPDTWKEERKGEEGKGVKRREDKIGRKRPDNEESREEIDGSE